LLYRGAEDLASKLKLLLRDHSLVKELGIKAREAAAEYSWDRVAPTVTSLYEELGGTR